MNSGRTRKVQQRSACEYAASVSQSYCLNRGNSRNCYKQREAAHCPSLNCPPSSPPARQSSTCLHIFFSNGGRNPQGQIFPRGKPLAADRRRSQGIARETTARMFSFRKLHLVYAFVCRGMLMGIGMGVYICKQMQAGYCVCVFVCRGTLGGIGMGVCKSNQALVV